MYLSKYSNKENGKLGLIKILFLILYNNFLFAGSSLILNFSCSQILPVICDF